MAFALCRLLFSRLFLGSVLQCSEQDSEQRVFIQQAFRSVRQLLQPLQRLLQLSALLPVLLLQLLFQTAHFKFQPPVVQPQLRQLLGQVFTGVMQRLNLLPESQELFAEDGAGSRRLGVLGLSVGRVCGAAVLQDEVQEVG